jgi:glutamate-ammonia-ligase adenylyltransferase
LKETLTRAAANSPFLGALIERQPDLVALIETGDFDVALTSALAAQADDPGVTLRRQRQGVALVTAIADLAGVWDLTRVTRILSDFADSALDTAIAAAFAERVPDAPVQGFAVIGLGKHGGRELNYSSDIDPIFLYDPQALPHREREDVADSAVRIGRRVIELLSTRDENGYVFRVDMRLRPSPESRRFPSRSRRRSAIMNRVRWRGSRRRSSALGRLRATRRWATISSKASSPLSGGAALISGSWPISAR